MPLQKTNLLRRPARNRSAGISAIAVLLVAGLTIAPAAWADPDPDLRIELRADELAFHLTGTGGTGFWLLQHSRDGKEWEDILFWEDAEAGSEPPNLDIPWGALRDPGARDGLFRAVQLENDDPFRRRFLTERTKWRLSGNNSYQYELIQNFGQISWHGILDVADDEVASFVTIDSWPPMMEPLEVPTIDDLFDQIAAAIAANVHIIKATWDHNHGAPLTCFIDRLELALDDESSWSIEAFTPAP